MLMNSIMKSYREFVRPSGSVMPIVVAPGIRKAANTSVNSQADTQARRQRRQSRLSGLGRNGTIGWSVRTW